MTTELSYLNFLKAQDHWSCAVESRVAQIQDFCSFRNASGTDADPVLMVENELAAMSFAITLLRTRRNALLPVSSLPSDVLCLIFSRLAGEEPPTKSRSTTSLGWIKATHVCRHWREVALKHARLWSDNVVSELGARWLEEMMARSESAPISLTYHGLSAENCGLLCDNISQVLHLQLTEPDQDLKSFDPELIRVSADALETLHISTPLPSHDYDLDEFPIPDHLFSSAPRLRRLVLNGFMIPASPVFRDNLTHLEVYRNASGDCDTVTRAYSQETLLGTLQGLMALQTLVLVDVLPPPVPIAETGLHTLHMPHLTNLTLFGRPERCSMIMLCLDIPATTQLSLELLALREDVPNFSEILSCVRAHARASSLFNPLRSLWVNVLGRSPLLRIWSDHLPDQRNPFEHVEKTASPQITIQLPVLGFGIDGTVLRDFIGALATPDLCALSVEIDLWYGTISPTAWKDILKGSTRLQYARICGLSALSFCESFTDPMNDDLEFMFPKLKILELHNVHFGLPALDADESLGDLLPRWLTRRQSQIALPRLAIMGCHVEEDWIDSLKELVEVDWDGNCGEYDSDWGDLGNESSSESDTDGPWSDVDPDELAQLVRDLLEGRRVPID